MGMFRFLSCMTIKLKVAVIYMSCWKPKPQLEVAAMSDSSGSWTGDCTEADGSFTEVTYDCPLDLIYSFGPIANWMVRVVSCFDVMFFFESWPQVKLSCGFGLVVWVFLITLILIKGKTQKL